MPLIGNKSVRQDLQTNGFWLISVQERPGLLIPRAFPGEWNRTGYEAIRLFNIPSQPGVVIVNITKVVIIEV